MRKIFISAGHSNKPGRDMGASSGSNVEGILAVEFRRMLVEELNKIGINPIVDSDNTILSESINFFRNITSSDSIVLDIHFNSGPSTATGTETLIPAEYTETERMLAHEISKCISGIMSIPMRGSTKGLQGVKTELESHHGRLGWMRLRGENVLMEICFISNPREMSVYHTKKREIASAVAQILRKAAVGNEVSVLYYTVKSGDSLWKIANQNGVRVDQLKIWNNLIDDNISIGQRIMIYK